MAIISALMKTNVAYLSADIGRLFRKRLDGTGRPFGITGAQLRVLLLVTRTPGLNQTALAALLEVEAITAGRMVDRMVAADLIERRSDPEDRRVWLIHPTEAGAKLVDGLDDQLNTMLETALTGLDGGERETLVALMERVRANLLAAAETEDPIDG